MILRKMGIVHSLHSLVSCQMIVFKGQLKTFSYQTLKEQHQNYNSVGVFFHFFSVQNSLFLYKKKLLNESLNYPNQTKKKATLISFGKQRERQRLKTITLKREFFAVVVLQLLRFSNPFSPEGIHFE